MTALTSAVLPKIHVLNSDLINKIAAGEVIERPASVVKELVENSIDASSRRITIELKNAGLDLIRVSDDGEGMLPDDARRCVERHATSKIKEERDLFSIHTLGFRGEALASIASISRLELETRMADMETGLFIEFSQGKIVNEKPTGRGQGATLSVHNLFYNVPVRKKFLKSPSTELGKILETVSRLGLTCPLAEFKIIHNTREILHFPQSRDLPERLSALLGSKSLSRLIPLSYENESLKIYGFAGNRDFTRNHRGDQYIFVNNRPVSSSIVSYALRSAYQKLIPESRFPVVVIFLTIQYDEVDVNIHPTKREVRFKNERDLLHILHSLLRNALERSATAISGHGIFSTCAGSTFSPMAAPDAEMPVVAEAEQQNLFTSQTPEPYYKHGETPLPVHYFQLHNTYILCQIKNGLLFIDQHVAHERIFYEKALAELSKSSGISQQLLFPVTLDLNPREKMVLEEYLNRFERLGFSIKFFSGSTIVVEAVAALLIQTGETERVIHDMLDYLIQNQGDALQIDDRVAKSYACGAAVKAGQVLSQEEMNALVETLFQCKNPYTCPHGRPILVRVSMEEISKRFLR